MKQKINPAPQPLMVDMRWKKNIGEMRGYSKIASDVARKLIKMTSSVVDEFGKTLAQSISGGMRDKKNI
jgi:hypothetical protein